MKTQDLQRKDGLYWLHDGVAWVIGRWEHDFFYVTGNERPFEEHEFTEIGSEVHPTKITDREWEWLEIARLVLLASPDEEQPALAKLKAKIASYAGIERINQPSSSSSVILDYETVKNTMDRSHKNLNDKP